MQQFQLSKNWRLEQRGNELYVLGGQDAIFTVELEEDTSFFTNLPPATKFTRDSLSAADKIVLEQLVSASVIVPLLSRGKFKKPWVKFLGQKRLIGQLEQPAYTGPQVSNQQPDLIILVRGNETMREFLIRHGYLNLKTPHLFVDLAYNHTISLGPLVFPGATSCVACLEGRLKARWGDELPPNVPKSSASLIALAKAWLHTELRAVFEDEDFTLVNKTIALDIQDRSMTHNKLLTVPLCPYCQKTDLLASGKMAYTAFEA